MNTGEIGGGVGISVALYRIPPFTSLFAGKSLTACFRRFEDFADFFLAITVILPPRVWGRVLRACLSEFRGTAQGWSIGFGGTLTEVPFVTRWPVSSSSRSI